MAHKRGCTEHTVKMCVVDAASILNTDAAKEFIVQMAKDEPRLERRVRFTLLLWDEVFDDEEDEES